MEGRIFQDGQAVRASREPEEQEDLSPGRSAGRPPKGLGPLSPEGDSPQQAAITCVRKGCWRGPGSFYTFSQGPQGPTLLPFPSEGDLEKTEQRKQQLDGALRQVNKRIHSEIFYSLQDQISMEFFHWLTGPCLIFPPQGEE